VLSKQASIHILDLEPSENQEEEDREEDRATTAERHWKYTTLARSLRAWIQYVVMARKAAEEENSRKRSTSDQSPPPLGGTPPPPPSKRKKLTPGITGLRNLGNTCYMNAVLQALSHIAFFREYLKKLGTASMQSQQECTLPDSDKRRQMFSRQTTVECFQHISHRPPGRSSSSRGKGEYEEVDGNVEDHVSLCNGLYELLRVMWSGKWATVTPHTFLNTVWKAVPSFYGFSQQDAQEFLCEFLDHLQRELESVPCSVAVTSHEDFVSPKNLLSLLFEGTLLSRITCDKCGNMSSREEPFADLSLDFPIKYVNLCVKSCDIM
jgi:ubiquitin carboxyl-terminal hydrolase 44/49